LAQLPDLHRVVHVQLGRGGVVSENEVACCVNIAIYGLRVAIPGKVLAQLEEKGA
jgi:hypothetical protein